MVQLPDEAGLISAAESRRDDRRNAAYAEIEAADRDFERDMEAIKRVQFLAQSPRLTAVDSERVPSVAPSPTDGTSHPGWPGLRQAIRQIIGRRSQPFTLHDVIGAMARLYPEKISDVNRAHVSAELWRIKNRHEIRILTEGAGSKAAVYEKVNGSPNGEATVKH